MTSFGFITVCEDGFYGLECSKECIGHCKDGPCNHTTGNCDKGCTDGWIGDNCDKGAYPICSEISK